MAISPVSQASLQNSRAIQLAFVAAMAGLWYASTSLGSVNRLLLPPPAEVLKELFGILVRGEFIGDMLVTLSELFSAFAMASVAGVTVGFVVSRTAYRRKVFEPLFAALYSLPAILLFPLLVLWFGLGPGSKIAIGVLIAFFPIVLNTIAAFTSVERIHVTAATSMGCNSMQLFWFVLFPSALPIICTGLRIGFIHGFHGVLGTETLASFAGLGHAIVNMAEQFETAKMFANILIAVTIAVSLAFLAFWFESRARRHHV